ncbi:hypothetical protein [uncultured Friedmanniella sp.]|uniref:hypothetical protein n=1 Tax=uncultured Friedmanniella sp. TaxID=335381 RepID=UPI0035CA4F3C
MSTEAAETIDPYDNRESRAAARDTSIAVSRANDGGAPPRDAPGPGELPKAQTGGTSEGNPVAGVTISSEDAAEAVPGDDGPDGSLPSSAGHA